MSVLMVPALDETPWPTLGPQVCEWMEESLVFGPGDLRGQDYKLDDEKRAIIYRLYEVFPRGHAQAGRRRFKRGGISVRKGWAKTELGAAVVAAELHPEAPVRCDGWAKDNGVWAPVGRGVSDPYIPMVAYTEEQSEELAYGALLVMLGEGPLADDFDLGVERIVVRGANGKAAGTARAMATAPDSRDGARTTFQLFDETHRLVLPRAKEAHQTMQANLPKRKIADPWSLEVTTSFQPGEGSVAEGTHEYAQLVAEGKITDSRLFFFHRQAGDHHDLKTVEGMRAAVVEASGPAAEWTDIDGIVELGLDPQTDRTYWERVWLNRIVAAASQFFPVPKWDELDAIEGYKPPKGARVVLGFDGSRTNDTTGIVGVELSEPPRMFVVAVWERPENAPEGWEIPGPEVDEAMDEAFATWDVLRLYPDPYWWETYISAWEGRFGTIRLAKRRVPRVLPWHTNRPKAIAYALRAFVTAIRSGELAHDGDLTLRAHLANARRQDLNLYDDEGEKLAAIRKERPDSPFKIDLAMAATLAWEAYRDVVATGGARKRSRVPRTI